MRFSLPLPMPEERQCRRCRQPIAGESIVHWKQPKGPIAFEDGAVLGRMAFYHPKCVPPNLHRKLSGSHPDGQSPAAASLGASSTSAAGG